MTQQMAASVFRQPAEVVKLAVAIITQTCSSNMWIADDAHDCREQIVTVQRHYHGKANGSDAHYGNGNLLPPY